MGLVTNSLKPRNPTQWSTEASVLRRGCQKGWMIYKWKLQRMPTKLARFALLQLASRKIPEKNDSHFSPMELSKSSRVMRFFKWKVGAKTTCAKITLTKRPYIKIEWIKPWTENLKGLRCRARIFEGNFKEWRSWAFGIRKTTIGTVAPQKMFRKFWQQNAALKYPKKSWKICGKMPWQKLRKATVKVGRSVHLAGCVIYCAVRPTVREQRAAKLRCTLATLHVVCLQISWSVWSQVLKLDILNENLMGRS